MIEKYLSNLSIHRLGFISSNIAGAIIFIFAILVINQEYKYYEEEISQIEKDYKTSTLAKQKILNEKKIEHKKKIMRYIIGIGGVGLFMFFAIYMLLRVVSFLIENELKEFLSQFSKASKEHVIIDKSNFNFEEFKSLIDNANHLVREIQENEKELLDLNKIVQEILN
jgi:uncharacterized FAD-dependent dehydrogenase